MLSHIQNWVGRQNGVDKTSDKKKVKGDIDGPLSREYSHDDPFFCENSEVSPLNVNVLLVLLLTPSCIVYF